MAKIFTNEVKTGLVVIVCLGILIAFTVSIGKFTNIGKQYQIKAAFSKVAGVQNDAPVRLSGVEIGKVDDVQLLYTKDGDTNVLLTLTIDNSAKLREGAEAYVTTLGLMGEKYIELSPGAKAAAYIKPGARITGKDPLQMEELIEIGQRIAEEVEKTLGDISSLTKHLDELVVENKTDINSIVGNLERTTSNLEEFSDDIKKNPWKLLVKGKEKK
ncbi:MAG: MCE family protein [Candidatus Omnitrophica bacterium]|nr:MCE family protein [Candidatus Omnitrophota bacterium]